jgi:hypothetical protein
MDVPTSKPHKLQGKFCLFVHIYEGFFLKFPHDDGRTLICGMSEVFWDEFKTYESVIN